MNNEKDIEYLSRPLIEETVYTNENGYIRISSSHTVFAEARSINRIDRNDILALYKSVIQKAKIRKVSISYKNRMRKKITEYWTDYEETCTKAADIFTLIAGQMKVVQERGIHYGTRDDAELDKMQGLATEYHKCFWRNSIILQISDIYGSLKEHEKDLSRPDSGLYQIYL